MKTFLGVILMICFWSSNSTAGTIMVKGAVKSLMNYEGHQGHLVKMSDMSATVGLCNRNDYYILNRDHSFAKENFSMLLSARVSEKVVAIYISDNASNKCVEGFPRIFHITF